MQASLKTSGYKKAVTFLTVMLGLVVIVCAITAVIVNKKLEPGLVNEAVQTRFLSYATTIAPLRRLEVAKISQLEIFERKSETKILWETFKLPDVVVRASVPVEYRYSVSLSEAWKINMTDETLEVVAPNLTPGTPSPDISALSFEVREGSFFRNVKKVQVGLQNELTARLIERSWQSTPLAKETARKELERLAHAWLKLEGKDRRVRILFADEPRSNSPL